VGPAVAPPSDRGVARLPLSTVRADPSTARRSLSTARGGFSTLDGRILHNHSI
jgi:hypothetical protein